MAVLLPSSLFIHIPKTGGTFVRAFLKSQNLFVKEAGDDHGPRPDIGERFTFTFLRHPLDWYRSYWRWRMMHDWCALPDNGWERHFGLLDDCRDASFDAFVSKAVEVHPGYLSNLYESATRSADFVGCQNQLFDHLRWALELGGERFQTTDLKCFPVLNNSAGGPAAPLTSYGHRRLLDAECSATRLWELAVR